MKLHLYHCRVNATEGGSNAILALAGGDLRRVLNLLQSTSMAYPQVTEDAVYLTAGAAMPKVIETIFLTLMSDSFEQAYKSVLKVRIHQNLPIPFPPTH
jgi:replication factor C subunit 3/5